MRSQTTAVASTSWPTASRARRRSISSFAAKTPLPSLSGTKHSPRPSTPSSVRRRTSTQPPLGYSYDFRT